MDDVFSFDVFTHEYGLFLNFSIGVGELDVVSRVDFRDVFGDFDVVFLEDLICSLVKVNHENDNISGQLREHVIKFSDGFPLNHSDCLVVYFLGGKFLFLDFN